MNVCVKCVPMKHISEDMLSILNEIFGEREMHRGLETRRNIPSYDVIENEKDITVYADMPGYKKEDIHLDIEDQTVHLKAERPDYEGEPNFLFRSRTNEGVDVSFPAKGIQTNKIAASYEDGVLKIVMPKIKKEIHQITVA